MDQKGDCPSKEYDVFTRGTETDTNMEFWSIFKRIMNIIDVGVDWRWVMLVDHCTYPNFLP